MTMTATKLRKLVIDNALTLGRLDKATMGEDYAVLTALYQNALDALTDWAGKDYAHKTEKSDVDNAFTHVKAILDLFTTKDDKIVIDQSSMRTMRDCATKPKRLYSDEYKKAEKARKEQAKQADSRYDDLLTLGCPERAEDEELADYVARVRALGVNTKSEKIDMLDMYQNALATLAVKTQKVESIKAKGNWTWKRPVAVSLTEFADLVENYIADCLTDGYNIKPTKVIREEQAAAREAKKAEKDAAKKGSITQHKMIKSIPKGAYHDGMPLLSIPNPSAL